MQEALDHVSARVTLAGVSGALAGSLTALYRGHHSILRTAGLTSLSCALVGTACFGTERVVHYTAKSFLLKNDAYDRSSDHNRYYFTLATHAAGGLIGGAWMGTLYLGRPLRGAFFFTPLMMLVATAEGRFAQMRRSNDQMERPQQQQQQQQQEKSTVRDNDNQDDGQDQN